MKHKLEQLLTRVSKPTRYTGQEFNSVVKDWETAKARMVFAFPDVYEVGMSHLGGKILYGLVNEEPDYLMERTFAPWVDMEELMRQEGLPLFSLESVRPVREFDVVGFSLQYELSITNVLYMLELAEIPLWSRERGEEDPLVIAGGPVCFNPEPFSPFFDAFLIGDGEEALLQILGVVKTNGGRRREDTLLELARIEGVYVPQFYKPEYYPDGTFKAMHRLHPGVSARIRKRLVRNLDEVYYPNRPIVPYLDIVHDRAVLEVMRGCQRACRFCQAGIIYRPVREKSLPVLLEQARELLKNTGYEDISLASLSTADYSNIEKMVTSLIDEHGARGVGVSLPSLRADAFSVKLAEEVQRVRKTTLTFAPEAGTQRLRDVINKNVSEQDLIGAVEAAFTAGWRGVKLYFMLGLPTETYEDLDGIIDLLAKVRQIGRSKAGKRVKITAGISNYVPKPHTPFQWEPQLAQAELMARHRYLLSKSKGLKGVSLDLHASAPSYLEAVIARGDRRLAAGIHRAFQQGCKFDGWREYFSLDTWLQAFAEVGVDPDFYALRVRGHNEAFPWDFIDTGVDKEYLAMEYARSRLGVVTPDCRYDVCCDCGICPSFGVNLELRGEDDIASASRV